jgi:hypothetical protein
VLIVPKDLAFEAERVEIDHIDPSDTGSEHGAEKTACDPGPGGQRAAPMSRKYRKPPGVQCIEDQKPAEASSQGMLIEQIDEVEAEPNPDGGDRSQR